MLGAAVRSFAVPGGFLVDQLEQYAREAGYEHVFTSRPGWALPHLMVPRISITNATAQSFFEHMALHDAGQMRKAQSLYQMRQYGKRLIGIGGYERLYRALSSHLKGPGYSTR